MPTISGAKNTMSFQSITHFKKAISIASLSLAIASPSYATIYNITGEFTMYSPSGPAIAATDYTITGTYDDTDPNSMTLSTTQLFFGYIWSAYNLKITTTPGTYAVEACPTPADGSVVPLGGGVFAPCTPPLPMNMTIGSNQWGVEMLFDWNTASKIDVLNVWDVTVNADGSIRLTSTDFDGDGILSTGMVDGPFKNNNASFNLLLSPPFPINITATQGAGSPVVLDPSGSAGNVTFDATVVDPAATSIAYDWSNSDSAIVAAAIGATNNASLLIDQTNAGLISGSNYKISVTVTKTLPSGTVISSTDTNIRVASFSLVGTDDTDLDTLDDLSEGFIDTDNDRIPEFLDPSATDTQLTVNPGDNTLGYVLSSEGTLALGNISYQNAIAKLTSTSTNNFGAAVNIATIGANDTNNYASTCNGGCTDITVTNMSGSSVQVVIPLSTAIPEHPLLRLYSTSGWNGFSIDDNNTIASAAANSNNPIDCPTPGLSAYSTNQDNNGLTPGNRCIQLTIEDGGPNDSDGTVNGSVSILTSVAELIISPPSTNGVGGGWWLLLGFPVLFRLRHFITAK